MTDSEKGIIMSIKCLTSLDGEVLETLNREFFKRVLIKILERLKNEVTAEERIDLLN